jgi:hypothetical protein
VEAGRVTAHEFLRLLFGHPSLSDLYVPLWFKWKGGASEHRTWAATKLDEAAAAAVDASDKADVYLRVTPIGFMPAGNTRGGKDDARALVALFADIDVAGVGHAKNDLPPDHNAAFDLLYECDKAPSVVVGSGGGLHAWWIFREPLLITDAKSLAEAKAMAEGWEKHVQARGRRHGWNLDTVAQLSRVLRVAGTKNHKTDEPRAVEVIEK